MTPRATSAPSDALGGALGAELLVNERGAQASLELAVQIDRRQARIDSID